METTLNIMARGWFNFTDYNGLYVFAIENTIMRLCVVAQWPARSSRHGAIVTIRQWR